MGVALLALAMVAIVGHWWWGRSAARRLEALVAAARAAGEPVTVEELNRWPAARGGAGENVVPALRAAAEAMDAPGAKWDPLLAGDMAVPLTDEEAATLAEIVESNSATLRSLEAALEKDGAVDWNLAYTSPVIEHQFPSTDFNGARVLGQLLRGDALLAHRAGDHRRALRRSRQIMALGRAVNYQPGLIPHLVALGLVAMGTETAGKVVPELTIASEGAAITGGAVPDGEARALIGELLDDGPTTDGWRRAMVGERVMQLDTAASIMEGRLSLHDVGGRRGEEKDMGRVARYAIRPYLLDNAACMAAHAGHVLRAPDPGADLHGFRAAVPQKPPEAEAQFYRYMVVHIMIPSLHRAAGAHARCIAERRTAAACLAIKLYAADHDGQFPETLDALVPAYLPRVPTDPLALGTRPLGYVNDRDEPQRPRVYSVGDNGADDGGAEPDPEASRRDNELTTDLVRHLKRQPRVFPRTMPFMYPGLYPGMPPWGPDGTPDGTADETSEESPATGPSTTPTTQPAADVDEQPA
jgi:hypothetical protein